MKKHIFVYGTLLFPEIIKVLTGKKLSSNKAVLHNYKRFKIDESNKKRPYPAIKYYAGEKVDGKVFFNLESDIINIFNFYEGTEYKEEKVNIISNGINYTASVYVWNQNNKYLKGKWDKKEFKKKYLEKYISKEIPEQFLEYNK